MSGAQAKAAVIAGCVGVIAEVRWPQLVSLSFFWLSRYEGITACHYFLWISVQVDEAPLKKRHEQGWLMEVTSSLEHCVKRIRYQKEKVVKYERKCPFIELFYIFTITPPFKCEWCSWEFWYDKLRVCMCVWGCEHVCIKSNSPELHMQYPTALFTKNMTCVCRVNMSLHSA